MTFVVQGLDQTLQQLFIRRVTQLGPAPVPLTQVGFEPPDRVWRSSVRGTRLALNVYLADLRENRKLRSNERIRVPQNGQVYVEPSPMRVECHYLITAWSPASDLEVRVAKEHDLLAEVLAVLSTTAELVPRQVFAPQSLPTGFPTRLADVLLPLTIVPPEGFPKLAEFWGTMTGVEHPWKPVVYVVVTVPLFAPARYPGPPVTTIAAEQRVGFDAAGAETLIEIGGHVLDSGGKAVRRAWVHLEPAGGGRVLGSTESNDDGEFTFLRIRAGTYALRGGAAGAGRAFLSPVHVPSTTGTYDLQLS